MQAAVEMTLARSFLPRGSCLRVVCCIVVLLLLNIALPACSASSASRVAPSSLPRRVVKPHFAPLHVVAAVFASSGSHAIPPLEICKLLAARGHRISWVGSNVSTTWVGSPEERAQLPFTFVTASKVPFLTDSVMNELLGLVTSGGVTGMDHASRLFFEPMYSPMMEAMQALVERDRPDVMVCDLFSHACTDIADKLGIPFVMTFPGGLGDFGLGDEFDTPQQFTGYSQHWHEQPMWHRFYNTYLALPYVIYNLGGVEPRFNQLRAKFGIAPNTAPMDKWAGHDTIFNGNFAWDYAKPLPPCFHLLGPIRRSAQANQHDVSNIAPELRQWLNESEREGVPVIYMALGSLASLPESEQSTFQQAFSSCLALPLSAGSNRSSSGPHFRVVWQTNKPLTDAVRAALPATVREEKWVAQPAVLAHPAVVLFVSHVGSGSIQESVAVGLPLLAVPFFGDQPGNAMRLQDAGVSLKVDHQSMTADELCHKIRHLTFDAEVRANIYRMQRVYHLSRHGAEKGRRHRRASRICRHTAPHSLSREERCQPHRPLQYRCVRHRAGHSGGSAVRLVPRAGAAGGSRAGDGRDETEEQAGLDDLQCWAARDILYTSNRDPCCPPIYIFHRPKWLSLLNAIAFERWCVHLLPLLQCSMTT